MTNKSFILIVLFLSFVMINIVNATDYIWDGGGGDSNWNTPNNWNLDSGYPGQNASDTATFNTGSANCTVNVSVSLTSITVTTGYSGTITQSASTTVTVSGDFNVTNGGSGTRWSMAASFTTISIGGNCYITGTSSFIGNGGNNTQTITLTGTGDYSLSTTACSGGVNILNCAQNGNTTTVKANTIVRNALNIGTGTVSIDSAFYLSLYGPTLTNTGTITGAGSFYIRPITAAAANVYIPAGTYSTSQVRFQPQSIYNAILNGNVVINGVLNLYNRDSGENTFDTNNYNLTANSITVGLTSSSNSTMILECNGSVITTNSLTMNSLSSSTTLAQINAGSSTWNVGNVTVSAYSIINAGSSIWNIGGIFSNSGTFNAVTSKVVFTGNNTLGANTFYDLTISGGTTTLSGNVIVSHDLTIGAGATLNPGAYTITVGRNITNAGNLTIPNLTLTGDITNSGTLTITGTSVALNGNITNTGNLSIATATINGDITNSATLNTGAMTIPSGKTVLLNPGSVWNVSSGSTITVNGTLRSSGTTSGLTTIQSSSTSGYFGLTINGSADLTGCKLYYLNTDGLKISSSGTITKIDNVDFKYGQTDGTHLQVLNGQTITITNITFDDITNGTNITVKNNTKLKVVKYTIGRFRDSIEAGSSIDYGVDARIDPNIGGRIADNGDANTYVEIPKGAIRQALTFTLYKLYSNELPNSSNTKDNVVIGYNIEAKDDKGTDVKRIDGAIVLVIHTKGDGENVLDVNNTSIGIRVNEATNRLCIGYWNERYWTKLGGKVEVSIDKRDITVRTNVSHLSRYAIVVKEVGGVITNVSPNPFTPAASQFNTITFSFNNEDSDNVEIKLWDITGVLVKTITNVATSSVVWDGRDEYGEIVEAGVYIYQLKVGNAKAGKGTIVVAK